VDYFVQQRVKVDKRQLSVVFLTTIMTDYVQECSARIYLVAGSAPQAWRAYTLHGVMHRTAWYSD
jgi:Mn2+/Fe2+ NRAMP family transporter